MKTMEDVEHVRKICDRLEELGVPRKDTDRIRRRANEAQKRIRDKARD